MTWEDKYVSRAPANDIEIKKGTAFQELFDKALDWKEEWHSIIERSVTEKIRRAIVSLLAKFWIERYPDTEFYQEDANELFDLLNNSYEEDDLIGRAFPMQQQERVCFQMFLLPSEAWISPNEKDEIKRTRDRKSTLQLISEILRIGEELSFNFLSELLAELEDKKCNRLQREFIALCENLEEFGYMVVSNSDLSSYFFRTPPNYMQGIERLEIDDLCDAMIDLYPTEIEIYRSR